MQGMGDVYSSTEGGDAAVESGVAGVLTEIGGTG